MLADKTIRKLLKLLWLLFSFLVALIFQRMVAVL